MTTDNKKSFKKIILCLLAIGIMVSMTGCLSQNTTSNPPLLSPEKICYEINPSGNTTEHFPEGAYLDPLNGPLHRYWVHIDPIGDHKAGEAFWITGCTNVSEGDQQFWGAIMQYEHFTPLGIFSIASTVKNISFTPGYNDAVRYFSYEVNSADPEFKKYTIYLFDILTKGPEDKNTSVQDWRLFNVTH